MELKTKDGETLSSYLLKAVKPQGITVLFMHGNAGNIVCLPADPALEDVLTTAGSPTTNR